MRFLCCAAMILGSAACRSERAVGLPPVVDRWVQATGASDVLWVVDNSGSMWDEQELLAQGFAAFADALRDVEDLDLQFAIATTRADDAFGGVLVGIPPVLPLSDPALEVFKERATIGARNAPSSDMEQGLESAARVKERPLDERGLPVEGFVRSGATFVVVVVSDEDDCSQGRSGVVGCGPAQLAVVDSLLERLQASRDPGSVIVSAIVGVPESSCGVQTGDRYLEAVARTGGVVGDLCAADWSEPLAAIGLASVGQRTVFQLSAWPDRATLQVYVDGWPPPRDELEYDDVRNAIVFDRPPPKGVTVEAHYDRGAPPG